MSSNIDIFAERAQLRKGTEKDLFEERAKIYQSPPSPQREILKQTVGGGARGLFGTYGNLLDLLGLQAQEKLPGKKAQEGVEENILQRMQETGYKPSLGDLLTLSEEDDILPRFSRLPASEEIGELLGISPEAETRRGRFASRIGEALGSGVALGASPALLGALGIGAAAGQTAEEGGASPQAAALVELLTSLGGGALKGKVTPSTSQGKKLAEAGRRIGLSEKELSPLLKGKRGFRVGATFTRKTEKLKKFADKIEEKLGDSYSHLKTQAQKAPSLSGATEEKLIDNLSSHLDELLKTHSPSGAKAQAINILENTIESLEREGTSLEKLINSYQDINRQPKKVRDLLEPVKKAYMNSFSTSSPNLAKDFQFTNKLYAQFMDRVSRMRPENFDKILNKAEALGIGGGLFWAMMGHPWALKGILAESGLRSLAKQYLTNPYLQNLPNKFMKALSKGHKKKVSLLARNFKKFLGKKKDISKEELAGVTQDFPENKDTE